MKKVLFIIVASFLAFTSCIENYSNGERIGVITKFSKSGVIWDSWDGLLNITQTGMNSSGEPFTFSVDNDINDENVIKQLQDAANYGWKVKIVYHQVWGFKNFVNNRGESDYFVDKLIILDKDFSEKFNFNKSNEQNGSVHDTIYVVINNSNK